MKYFYVIVSLILSVSGNAQNWSLVMPNDTLVYENQNNNQFFTVWVDSTHVNGTDTTYFMNRISPGEVIGTIPVDSLCDTLVTSPSSYDLLKLYHPQFCGESIFKSGVKWTIQFHQKKFVIFPNKQLGESWVYDSITMDSMIVTNIDTAILTGYQSLDSIKTLQYGTHKITISKNHGLIAYYDFRDSQSKFKMIGVQNLGTGEIIPMGLDFFDFEVGDVFARELYSGDSDSQDSGFEKKTILSKQQVGDTLIYTINNSLVQGITTEKYWPNKNEYLNSYPNTISHISREYFVRNIPSDTVFTNVIVSRYDNGGIIKGNTIEHSLIGGFYYCISNNDSAIAEDFDPFRPVYIQYKLGFGIITHDGSFSLYMEGMRLVGYVKNGDTTGIVNSVPKISINGLFKIYPNPTHSVIHISTEKLNGISILEMYDLQGRIVMTKTFNTSLKLDVSNWAKGIYFTVIKNENGAIIHRQKVVAQ